MKFGEQFVVDADGKRVAVMLDLKTYERMREAEEELADIRAFDKAWPAAQEDLRVGKVVSLSEYKSRRAGKGK